VKAKNSMNSSSTQISLAMNKIKELEQEIEHLKILKSELTHALEASNAASNAKSEFIANISHDLRTPLHAILSFSRFGINKTGRIEKDKIIKYFSRIEESGKKLQVMLDRLVDLSKLESGRMVFQMYTCRLSTVIQSLEKETKSRLDEKKITLQIEISDKVNSVNCDQYKIAYVMNALLNNAIENSPPESKVIIRVEEAQKTMTSSGAMLQVCFQDHRIDPFPNELISNFESYLQTEKAKFCHGDFGVDLAICNEIIKQHKGRLWVEHDSDGSSFCFTLPVDQ